MKHEKLSQSHTYVPRTNLIQTFKTMKHKKNNILLRNSPKDTFKHNK